MTKLIIDKSGHILDFGDILADETGITGPRVHIPADIADGVTVVEYDAPEGLTLGDHGARFIDGAVVLNAPPAPEVAPAELVKHYDGIVQGRLDAHARTFGYGDPNRPEISPILHVISYADEPAVVKFQAEGRLFRAWRSRTWAASGDILNAVNAGEREIPSESDLLAELETAAPAPTADDVAAEIDRLTTT